MSSAADQNAETARSRLTSEVLAGGGVLLLAALLRCYQLGGVSLWTDELFTAFYPHLGLRHLWFQGFATEPTPPLYYTLIWAIEHTIGQTAVALRLPSVIGSLLGIWLAGRLARELRLQPGAAVFAMLLLALSPTNLLFAQEARSYALQGAALALTLLGFARALRGNACEGRLLYLLGAALALWLHPTSFAAVLAINLVALISTLGRGRLLDGAGLRRWVLANAALFCLAAPLFVGLLSSNTQVAIDWIPPLNRWTLQQLLGEILAGRGLSHAAAAIAEIALPLLAALLLLPPWRPGRRAAAVLLLVPALFMAIMIGISLLKPILLSRTIAWTLIPLAAILGDVMARRSKLIAAGLIGLSIVALGFSLARIDTLNEDWKGLLARLPGLSPAALIVLSPHSSPGALALYAPDAGTPVRLDDGDPPMPETSMIPPVFGTATISRHALAAAIASGRPLWLLYRRPEYHWILKLIAGLPPPKLSFQDSGGSNPNIRALRW